LVATAPTGPLAVLAWGYLRRRRRACTVITVVATAAIAMVAIIVGLRGRAAVPAVTVVIRQRRLHSYRGGH